MQKINLPKEGILKLYLERKVSSEKIAAQYCCTKRTVLLRLHEWKVSLRSSGVESVNLKKEKLKELYIKKRLSAQKIGNILECGQTTVLRKLKFYGIKSRDISASHIRYPRKHFSENLFEKAYLVGFTAGDLRVRRGGNEKSKTIKIGCGSSRKEQVELFEQIFQNYGRVWISKPIKGKINMEAFLDMSFEFLLDVRSQIRRIFEDNRLFEHFLAGFVDAEGSFYITNQKAEFSIGNYNFALLNLIRNKLLEYEISLPELYPDKKLYEIKGGYKRNKIYWHLFIHKKKSILKLIGIIGVKLKHKKRIKDMQRVKNFIRKKGD